VQYLPPDKGTDALGFRGAIEFEEIFREWFPIGEMAWIKKFLEGDLAGGQLS